MSTQNPETQHQDRMQSNSCAKDSPSSASSKRMPSKTSPKVYLKQMYDAVLGDSKKEKIKPIHWYNTPYWWRYTYKTDRNHYLGKSRPVSWQRLSSFLFPNLKAPIFIVGSPRSGTTFLGKCIAQLPEISYHFEPVATKAAARYVYDRLWHEDKSQRFYQFIYRWLMRFHGDGDLRFAEKTPQISFIVPFLAKAFPEAKFVHIIRDGRDVAASLAEKPWHRLDKKNSTIRDPDGYMCGPWARFWVEPDRIEEFETTDDLHRCGWIWRRHVEEVLQAAVDLPNGTYHELRYEDLVENPRQEAQKILEFLGISDQQSHQLFQEAVAKDVRASSVGRWRATVPESALVQLEAEISPLMQKLDYLE